MTRRQNHHHPNRCTGGHDDDGQKQWEDELRELSRHTPTTAPTKSNMNISIPDRRKSVGFDPAVGVREYERILCDHPGSAYAMFALGWRYNDSSSLALYNDDDGVNDNQVSKSKSQEDDITAASSSSSLRAMPPSAATSRSKEKKKCTCIATSKTKRSECWSFIAKNNECSDGHTRAVRYTASERVKILGGYGFSATDIVRLEKQKKELASPCCIRRRKAQRRQRQLQDNGTGLDDENPVAVSLPACWFQKLRQKLVCKRKQHNGR